MKTGIYILQFNNTHKVYVGQAGHIEYRYTRHLTAMRRGTNSIKLNKAFLDFGEPKLEIISECGLNQLDEYENEVISIFNSVVDGFNTYEASRGRSSISGENTAMSKFSNSQIEEAFFLLLDPSIPITDIEKATGVSQGSINVLSRGFSHTYLKDLYPEEYSTLISLIGSRRAYVNSAGRRGIVYPTIVSPQGVEYDNISNVKEFAKTHGLSYDGLSRVLTKNRGRKVTNGWTLKEYID